MKIKSKLSLTFLIIVLVPLILGMVVLYQSTKSSIQAIQEDSAQRYVDTVRDRLSAYFDKWKVTVDALSKMPEVKSKDWGKLKPILNAISSAIRDDQGKVIGALCTSMAADALNYQAYCHYYGNSQYKLCHYGLILYQWTVYQAHSAGKRNVEPACIRNRRFGYPYG